MTRLLTYVHTHTTEVIGFVTGGSAGTLAYIQWQDKLITCALALVTGFLGACGASLFKYLVSKIKK